MSDVISLEWIGAQLRGIQAEHRTVGVQVELMRGALRDTARFPDGSIGNSEARMKARLDQIDLQLDRIEALLRTLRP